jgi:large subunit ribosomal protein L29
MKASDLRERTTEHLAELEKSLAREIFDARFKNHTARLNDTASIRRLRRDLARVKTILVQRAAEG